MHFAGVIAARLFWGQFAVSWACAPVFQIPVSNKNSVPTGAPGHPHYSAGFRLPAVGGLAGIPAVASSLPQPAPKPFAG